MLKNIRFFLSESFHFMVVKISVYLNRHVFVIVYFGYPRMQSFFMRRTKAQFRSTLAELSFLWVHLSEVTFPYVVAHLFTNKKNKKKPDFDPHVLLYMSIPWYFLILRSISDLNVYHSLG